MQLEFWKKNNHPAWRILSQNPNFGNEEIGEVSVARFSNAVSCSNTSEMNYENFNMKYEMLFGIQGMNREIWRITGNKKSLPRPITSSSPSISRLAMKIISLFEIARKECIVINPNNQIYSTSNFKQVPTQPISEIGFEKKAINEWIWIRENKFIKNFKHQNL